jgi:ATP-binding cassette subfamily C protein/ATP-binding cassette subfamily C protein EexD
MASGGHRYFGYLPQDVELFAGTVAENISRLSEASSTDVIAAARLVDLHDTIMRLPKGYDTNIGEGGARLSGGQRQKLGLARAFFRDPRLIVLDEPNASLDPEGEESLRQAIAEMKSRGATVIIIAQRLGILSVADSVLVLDNGMVNAYGERREIAERISQGRTAIRVVQQAKSKSDARMPKVDEGPMIVAPGAQVGKGVA